MPTIWLTYAWDDNIHNDVDFIAQEIESVGVNVKLDRWNIRAGLRLWEQIENFIQNKDQSDAWILYATQNSLGSEACKEEFSYALDRALHSRGGKFPIIGLFPSTVDRALIPAAIKVRLFVSLTDPDWKERIKAEIEGREPSIARSVINAFYFHLHDEIVNQGGKYIIEVRPRAGTWSPVVVAIPISEKDEIEFNLIFGPAGQLPRTSMVRILDNGISNDGEWKFIKAENEVTPTQSCFIYVNKLPSRILFGPSRGDTYIMQIK